jgi:hypothetical protein
VSSSSITARDFFEPVSIAAQPGRRAAVRSPPSPAPVSSSVHLPRG